MITRDTPSKELPLKYWFIKYKDTLGIESFEIIYNAILSCIKEYFIAKIKTNMDYSTPTEQATWEWQRREALAYKENNNSDTPFIDGMLESIQEENENLDKNTLVNRIILHTQAEYQKSIGKLHGKMYTWIMKARKIKKLNDLDKLYDLFYDFNEYIALKNKENESD